MLDETNSERGMSLIVKTVARWLTGFVLFFGVYVTLYGHDTPGGGFAAAAAIASGFILLMLAFGRQLALRKLGQRPASVLASTGVCCLALKREDSSSGSSEDAVLDE